MTEAGRDDRGAAPESSGAAPSGEVSTRDDQLPVTSRANRSASVLNSDAALTASMVE